MTPPSLPPYPPLSYATTTSLLLSPDASSGLSVSDLTSSLTQAATSETTSSVQVSLVVQSSLDATVPASKSPEQMAAAMQLSVCGTSDTTSCSVGVSSGGRRQLQSSSVSFTVAQTVAPTANQSMADLLVAPSVNASDVSSLLAVDESELSMGTPSVAGVAATLVVEAEGVPDASTSDSLSASSMASALGVDA